MGQRLRERQKEDGRDAERQGSGAEGLDDGAAAVAPARAVQLIQEVEAGRGDRVEDRFGVAGSHDEKQGRDDDADGPAAGTAREAAQPEQEQRKGRRRGRKRITQEEHHVVRKGPADGSHQARNGPAPELAEERVPAEQRQEDPQGHLEGPCLRQRKKKADPRAGVEHCRLLDGEQRLPGEHVRVPERKLASLDGRAHGLSPRNFLVHDVRQDRFPRGANAQRLLERQEGMGLVHDVERRIDRAGERRPSREQKRCERDCQRGGPRERSDEPVDSPEADSGRREIHRDRPQDEQEHLSRSYPPFVLWDDSPHVLDRAANVLHCGIPVSVERVGGRGASAGPEADRRAASLLLPRDVPAAGDERPERRGVVAGRHGARLRDAGHALAAEGRFRRGGAADGRSGLRLGAGLVAGRALHPLYVLPQRRARAVGARPPGRRDACPRRERRRESRRAVVAGRHARSRTCRPRSRDAGTSSSSASPTARRPASPSASRRTRTAACRATTTRSSTSTSRRPGRPTARSSSSSPTAATCGAPETSGA